MMDASGRTRRATQQRGDNSRGRAWVCARFMRAVGTVGVPREGRLKLLYLPECVLQSLIQQERSQDMHSFMYRIEYRLLLAAKTHLAPVHAGGTGIEAPILHFGFFQLPFLPGGRGAPRPRPCSTV